MRPTLAALFACSLALRAGAEPVSVEIAADELDASGFGGAPGTGFVEGRGNVRVRSGALLLRAPAFSFDRARGAAALTGGVVGADGLLVLSATRLDVDLDTRRLRLLDGRLVVKAGVAPARVANALASDDPRSATRLGRDALTLRAAELTPGVGSGFSATGVWLSTCDCSGDRTPLLALSAERVEVVPGEVARLAWWKLRIFDVPVTPPLPAVSLPLSSRATGVLFPVWALNGPGGFTLDLPFFVTIGESADVTLHARWMDGNPGASRGAPGLRGWGAGTEWRWRPAIDSSGSLLVDVVDDTSRGATTGPRGVRGSARLLHASSLVGGRLAIDAALASDSGFLFDSEPRFDRSQLPYLPSVASWSRARGPLVFGLSSTSLQVLDGGRHAPFAAGSTAAVSPIARAFVLRSARAGPLTLDTSATLSWESALVGDRTGARAERAIASTVLGQTMPLAAGRLGQITLEPAERVDAFTSAGALSARAGAFAGLAGTTRLERRFESGWTHVILPSLRLRGYAAALAPYAEGLRADAGAPLDESDAALPGDARGQVVARLATRLDQRGVERLSLWAEQHLELAPATTGPALDAGQLHFGLSARLGGSAFAPLVTASGVRDLALSRFAYGALRLSGALPTGAWNAGALVLEGAQSDLLARAPDVLFTPRTLQPAAGTDRTLAADASFSAPFGDELSGALSVQWTRHGAGEAAAAIAGALRWTPGGCATVGLAVRFQPRAGLDAWQALQVNGTFELGDVGAATRAAAASSAADE